MRISAFTCSVLLVGVGGKHSGFFYPTLGGFNPNSVWNVLCPPDPKNAGSWGSWRGAAWRPAPASLQPRRSLPGGMGMGKRKGLWPYPARARLGLGADREGARLAGPVFCRLEGDPLPAAGRTPSGSPGVSQTSHNLTYFLGRLCREEPLRGSAELLPNAEGWMCIHAPPSPPPWEHPCPASLCTPGGTASSPDPSRGSIPAALRGVPVPGAGVGLSEGGDSAGRELSDRFVRGSN